MPSNVSIWCSFGKFYYILMTPQLFVWEFSATAVDGWLRPGPPIFSPRKTKSNPKTFKNHLPHHKLNISAWVFRHDDDRNTIDPLDGNKSNRLIIPCKHSTRSMPDANWCWVQNVMQILQCHQTIEFPRTEMKERRVFRLNIWAVFVEMNDEYFIGKDRLEMRRSQSGCHFGWGMPSICLLGRPLAAT